MRAYLTTAIGAIFLVACTRRDRDGMSDTTGGTAGVDSPAAATTTDGSVSAVMRDANGRDLGTLTFTDGTGGIAVSGRLTGLPPGEHGMHLHTTGRCDAPTFESAGGHWNPTSRQHGTENPQGPHLGDLPNVTVGADSTASVQAVTSGGKLRGTTDMLLDADGAALIIHSGRDDNRTDPAGGSGARLACAIVRGS